MTGGSLSLTFADAFVGGLDEVSITYEENLVANAQSVSYQSTGSDAQAVFNGELIAHKKNEYVIRQQGVEIALQLAKGFQGEIDAFTIAAGGTIEVIPSASPLTGSLRSRVQKALRDFFSIASGGELAVAASGSSSTLAITFDALASLQALSSGSNRFGRRSLTGNVFDRLS